MNKQFIVVVVIGLMIVGWIGVNLSYCQTFEGVRFWYTTPSDITQPVRMYEILEIGIGRVKFRETSTLGKPRPGEDSCWCLMFPGENKVY